MIRLRLSPHPLESAEVFVAIAAFTEEEFPLAGAAGRLDAALGAEASALIRQGRLSGRWNSQALLASRGRAGAAYCLFAGLGSRKGLTLAALSRKVEGIAARMRRLSAPGMALEVIGQGAGEKGYAALAAETLNGALRALAGCPHDVDVVLCEPDPRRYEELTAVAESVLVLSRQKNGLSLEVVV